MSELSTLPPYEAKSFMRWVAKATEAYFENPDVKRRFEEWKKERENEHINVAKEIVNEDTDKKERRLMYEMR